MAHDFDELTRKFDASPFAAFLGMKLVELSDRYAKVAMVLRPEHRNFTGGVHGGLIMSLADQAFACGTNTLDGLYVAIQFNINFFAVAADGETIFAECRVMHGGKSIGVAEIVVADSRGRVLARATGTVANVQRS
ncbi:MAG: PaaI family thioesterase [Chloroflexi bacterium]|nr:PaaI family thioesterase [Chloroflexota bacterium]